MSLRAWRVGGRVKDAYSSGLEELKLAGEEEEEGETRIGDAV